MSNKTNTATARYYGATPNVKAACKRVNTDLKDYRIANCLAIVEISTDGKASLVVHSEKLLKHEQGLALFQKILSEFNLQESATT